MRSMSKAARASKQVLVLMMMVKQPVLSQVLSLARDCSSSASLPTLKLSFEILKIDIKLCSEIEVLPTIGAAHLASSYTSQ